MSYLERKKMFVEDIYIYSGGARGRLAGAAPARKFFPAFPFVK